MRKLIKLIIVFAVTFNTANAAFTENKVANHRHTLSSTDEKSVAEFLINFSRKDYEDVSGRHLSLIERLAFNIAQRNLRKQLKKTEEDSGEKTTGFLIGFFLWLPGLLLVYLLSKNATIRKWALIGAIVDSVIILLITLFILGIKSR